ncbi:granzyme B-like [Polypterus senegalus]|uniref:granzyme B-like n=1 Tax=Polypterus senegalus TaxID=55291 RepID=UPI001966CAAB|nr:granzyme B-like [Polypterus senegalus]XP_039622727.1 granzyme B-like [Polypterus senegalus]
MQVVYWGAIVAICFSLAGASGDKIIKGHEVKPHSRPYMAALYAGKPQKFICGGFLILPNYVLTAAHCKKDKIIVYLGSHNISKKEMSRQMIPVQSSIPHEKYDRKTLANDIMLLKLKHKAKLTNKVRTIGIPKRDVPVWPGTICWVAGWGFTTENGKESSVLREVKVKVQAPCASASQICARGAGIKGACEGDSGGPLVCPDNMKIPTAVGILSFETDTCENSLNKNIYVSVSAYREWIERKIKSSSSM